MIYSFKATGTDCDHKDLLNFSDLWNYSDKKQINCIKITIIMEVPQLTEKRKRTTATQRTRKSAPKKKGFYEGFGNEITGAILIGVGLLLMAGLFTDKTGKLGELLKKLVFSLTGILGYLVPLILVIWGFAFIVRKSGLFAGRRAIGVSLILLSFMVVFSLKNNHLGNELGFFKALIKIPSLTEINHGGILGFIISYPIEKLVGVYGSYIFSIIGIIIGCVLIFNTTIYDSLKFGKSVSDNINTKFSNRLQERRERLEAIRKEEEKKELLNRMEVPQIGVSENESENDGESEDDSVNIRDFRFGNSRKSEGEKISVPVISYSDGEDDKLTYSGEGESQDPMNKFNIRVRGMKDKNISDTSEVSDERDIGKTGLDLKDIYREGHEEETQYVNPDEDNPEFLDIEDDASDGRADNEGHHDTAASEKRNSKTSDADGENLKDEIRQSHKTVHQISVEEAETKQVRKYNYPDVSLLKQNIKGIIKDDDRKEIMENAQKLQDILKSFGIEATVIHVSKGPTVTRYELQPKPGIKVSKIVGLSDDIAMGLAASGVRIEAPIPGKGAVGIEIPNKETSPVFLREVIESEKFSKGNQKLAIALGKDISGEPIIGDMTRFPHVLIAGATGSGKSVCINSLIVSLLYKYTPEEVRLIMVDPKMVELSVYNGIPHLLIPVVTDPKKAAGALNWAVNEMTRRYKLFADNSVKNIDGYNDLKAKGKIDTKLPYIVIIVDELADLMMVAANEVENYVMRLAQMARAAGMHLVIATQRPSVDVITGVIKANIPSRISFAVSSYVDSKTILDQSGAEKLLGKGDMLYCPVGVQKAKRVQGAFISEEEVESIVEHIKIVQEEVEYDENIINHIESNLNPDHSGSDDTDELFSEAARIVIENGQASTSFIQRRMRIGYNRAARIVEEMELKGVISGPDGAKPRKVLWTMDDLRASENNGE